MSNKEAKSDRERKRDSKKNEYNNGKLWFGMADGNVYQFNGKTFEKQF